jgi:hypothetical protein
MDWDQRATVLLLANLDYNICQFEKDGKPRDKKVLQQRLQEQLKEASIIRSQKKIDLRLHKLWNDNRNRHYQKSYEEIYRSGTKCLRNLDPGLRRSVQHEVTVIQNHGNLLRSGTPRTLRSGSQNIRLDNRRSLKRESTDLIDIASIDSPLTGKHGSRLQQGSGSLKTTSQANRVSTLSRRVLTAS